MPAVLGLLHEVDRLLDQHLVEGGHVVFGIADSLAVATIGRASGVGSWRQRPLIDDLLLADLAPARLDGGIVGVARPAMHEVARTDRVPDRGVGRIGIPVRIRHRVEVVQIAEELIEAVHAGKVLVQIAEMVLAELAGGVAHGLERGGNGRRLRRQADIGASLTDRGHAGANGKFASDEIGTSRCAARFGIVIGEAHALRRQPVKVRRLARHDALMIGADIEPADVVAHDEEDIGLLRRLSAGGIRLLDSDNSAMAPINAARKLVRAQLESLFRQRRANGRCLCAWGEVRVTHRFVSSYLL